MLKQKGKIGIFNKYSYHCDECKKELKDMNDYPMLFNGIKTEWDYIMRDTLRIGNKWQQIKSIICNNCLN